ncbi:T9SS type A sorting domain-containing protein [Chryseobacterium mucoviscidosis]|uniref:T9SS type A sorting domain-containing protein n=1 Tax=Chryseobacterium mucoviscidosis TaxID=1945581 RepID=UPI0031DEBEB7
MKNILFLFIIFFNSLLFAQNINSTLLETNFGGDSEPDHLTKIGNKIYFSASVYNDRELYVKDDLTSKPHLVKDINTNYGSISSSSFFKELNGTLLFTATSNSIGNSYQQLWRSDGTENGTYLLKIINPNYDTNISNPIILGNKMFFTTNVNNSSDLWVTDGTEAGTKIVKKINSTGDSSATYPFIFNNEIYFLANDGITGMELWKSNGTENGTVLVFDFYTGSSNGIILKPIVYNNNIYFIGKQSANMQGLWKYDGTQTQLVKNFININYFDPVILQNKIIFCINTTSGFQLWSSDGTVTNTNPLFTTPPYSSVITYSKPLRVFNNKLYFEVTDSSFNTSNWISGGTASSTVSLSSTIPVLSNATIVGNSSGNNYLIFRSNNNDHYISDGTISGTKFISDITLISNYTGYGLNVLEYNDSLILNGKNKKNGIELFKYNFSTNLSTILDDIHHKMSSDINASVSLNNKLIYFGNGFNEGTELFTSDGTASNTKLLKDMNVGEYSTVYTGDNNYFFKNGSRAFFRCTVGTGYEPCVTDGTEAGTYLIKDLSPFNQGSLNEDPYFMTLDGNNVLFGADDGANNTTGASRLWRTDGTQSGTYKIHDVQIVGGNGYKSSTLNGKVYFTGYDTNNVYSIWVTDGTTAGTYIFKTFYDLQGNNIIPRIINTLGNQFVIIVNDVTSQFNFYQKMLTSDGISSANITQIATFAKSSQSSGGIIGETIVYNNKLYFYAFNYTGTYPTDAYKLYSTDGTITGTNVFSSLISSCCVVDIKFNICGSKLYILKDKLYVTDGINQPVALDNGSHAFKNFNCVNDNLFFLNNQYQDYKIWTSNGTVSGTYPFNLYANGHLIGNNESIYKLASTNDKLFYLANFYNTDVLKESGGEVYIVDINAQNLGSEDVVQNSIKGSGFIVFPNPTADIINIQSKDGNRIDDVKIYDLSGKLFVTALSNNYNLQLNINDLIKGVYVMVIRTGNTVVTKKIIKK